MGRVDLILGYPWREAAFEASVLDNVVQRRGGAAW